MTSILGRYSAIAFCFFFLSLATTKAQLPAKEPFTQDEVLALVTASKLGEIPIPRIVELIKQRGVGFMINEVFLLELEVREADNAIIKALKDLKNQGKDFFPPTVKTVQPPAEIPPIAPGKVPTEQEWPGFLETVRARAMSYTDDLPNFICTQVTQRSIRFFPGGWRSTDSFVADLSYYDKKEHYKIITVSNKPTTKSNMEDLKGAWSTGEFGTTLRSIFDPHSNASFRLEGADQINGHDTIRISYQVPLAFSSRSITYEGEDKTDTKTVITAYRGRCWIDPTSHEIVKVEDKALNIPENFPITRSERALEYDQAEISGKKFWLPVRAEMILVEGAKNFHNRNVIEFKRYRKFEAEVKLDTGAGENDSSDGQKKNSPH
jgi:hypothetical protein